MVHHHRYHHIHHLRYHQIHYQWYHQIHHQKYPSEEICGCCFHLDHFYSTSSSPPLLMYPSNPPVWKCILCFEPTGNVSFSSTQVFHIYKRRSASEQSIF